MPTDLFSDPAGHADTHDATPLRPRHAQRRHRWLAAAIALAVSAGSAAAAQVRISIAVGESGRPPVLIGSVGDGAVFSDGTRHTGAAAFGNGSAAFDITPQLGLLSLHGQSALTTLAEWGGLLRETSAGGQLEISDSFRIEGPIAGTVAGVFVARVSAQLLPAFDFEQEFFAARNQATATTNSRTQLLLSQRTPGGVIGENRLHDQVGSWLGPGAPCACTIGTDLEVEFVIPLLISDDSREFSFNLNTFIHGTRGGGFAYGGAAAAPDEGEGLLGALAASDPASTLSFELRLPPGLSFSSGGANFMHLVPLDPPGAIPEPALPGLLFAAGVAAAWSRRRGQAGTPSAMKCSTHSRDMSTPTSAAASSS